MELDIFGIGNSDKSTYYSDSTKFVKLQEEHYVLNNVIGKIASTFANGAFQAESENNELVKLANNPNDKQSKEEFWKEFAIFLLSSGYTMIWKRYKSYGSLSSLELINLNPDKTDIGETNLTTEIGEDTEEIPLTEVIIFYDSVRKHTNNKGYSRITPLKTQINNIKSSQLAKGIQIDNSGTTIVSPKAVNGGNAIDDGLNALVPVITGGMKTQKQEMEDRLNNRGISNRIIVSNKGLDAKNLSSELNNVKFSDIVETDILAVYDAFNFPIELSPYGKDSTFENKAVAEISLIEKEIYPLAKNVMNSLNSEFSNKKPITEVNYKHLNSMSIIDERIQKTNGETINQLVMLLDKEAITPAEFKKTLKDKKIIS
jgi:hypothetical protein